jgi:hypothetical protein
VQTISCIEQQQQQQVCDQASASCMQLSLTAVECTTAVLANHQLHNEQQQQQQQQQQQICDQVSVSCMQPSLQQSAQLQSSRTISCITGNSSSSSSRFEIKRVAAAGSPHCSRAHSCSPRKPSAALNNSNSSSSNSSSSSSRFVIRRVPAAGSPHCSRAHSCRTT